MFIFPGDWLSSRPLYQLSSNVRIELYYNLGVTLLHMNKPEKAFDFLLEVLQVHSTNPRLWLRLAECCVAVHKAVSIYHILLNPNFMYVTKVTFCIEIEMHGA